MFVAASLGVWAGLSVPYGEDSLLVQPDALHVDLEEGLAGAGLQRRLLVPCLAAADPAPLPDESNRP